MPVDDTLPDPLPETGTAAGALPDPVALEAAPANKPLSLVGIGLILLLALIWGSSFILMKRGLRLFTPVEIGALRMVSAGAFLIPFGLVRLRRIQRRFIGQMVLSGLIGSFIPAFLFATAGAHIDSAISGSLNALSPLFTLLLGVLFYGTRTSWRGYLGIALGLAGALALSLTRAMPPGAGLGGIVQALSTALSPWTLPVVLATICYAVNVNQIKVRLQAANPVDITAVAFIPLGILGALILAFATPFPARMGQPGFWGVPLAAIVTLGVMGSAVSWLLYNRLLKSVSAFVASTVTYLMPVVSLAWGVADGERILPIHYVGLALILSGLGLVALTGRRR